jgi:hypothetical protein
MRPPTAPRRRYSPARSVRNPRSSCRVKASIESSVFEWCMSNRGTRRPISAPQGEIFVPRRSRGPDTPAQGPGATTTCRALAVPGGLFTLWSVGDHDVATLIGLAHVRHLVVAPTPVRGQTRRNAGWRAARAPTREWVAIGRPANLRPSGASREPQAAGRGRAIDSQKRSGYKTRDAPPHAFNLTCLRGTPLEHLYSTQLTEAYVSLPWMLSACRRYDGASCASPLPIASVRPPRPVIPSLRYAERRWASTVRSDRNSS